jgi:Ca-activated chloride channel homolog
VSEFHFLRPEWLWALLPAIVIPLLLWRTLAGQHGWQKYIDSAFLPYLQAGLSTPKRQKISGIGLTLLLALTSLTLAGPAWEKRTVPVEQRGDALILVVDLSLSMLAEDISPSRIGRARMKLLDILQARKEGTTALVVYAGDAHVVTPLSDDSDTLAAMVPALSPEIMPALGSRVDLAIEKALQLAEQAGSQVPYILLLSDAVTQDDVAIASKILASSNAKLGVLGIGTQAGGPVQLPNNQGLLRNRDGSIAVPKLSRDTLNALAQAHGGLYRDISLDDSDWQSLLTIKGEELSQSVSERQFDQWFDRGAYLSLLVLLGLLPLFKRGLIFSVFIVLPAIYTPSSKADSLWDNLWQRPDQRGAELLQGGEADAAASSFTHPEWRAIANYRAGNFKAAEAQLNTLNTPRAHYNRGNALAKAGDLEGALQAYNTTLTLDPNHEDAAFNKALVEKLKQQQEQEQEQEQQDNQQGQPQQGEESSSNENSQDPSSDEQTQSQQPQPGDDSTPSSKSDSEDEAAATPEPNRSPSAPSKSENPTGEDTESPQEAPAQPAAFDDLSDEEKQTMEQWLRQIPDDPGGLLRRKFRYQYEQRRLSGQDEVPDTWY